MATEVKIRLTKKDIWTIPNILSYFRILMIPVMILCYLYVENPWAVVGVIVVSGLTDMEPEEMSHIAGLLRQQEGPVSEQAFMDCLRTIRAEHQASRIHSEDDLLAYQNKLKKSIWSF